MRALDLLLEKGLRIGQRELEQGAAIGDLFTFGFEAELGYRHEGGGDTKYYQTDELEDIDDLIHALELHPSDVDKLETMYNHWRDQAAEEITQIKIDDEEIDEDDWDEEYGSVWESLSQSDWIETVGADNIIGDLNPRDVDWEIEAGELIVHGSGDGSGEPTDMQLEDVMSDFAAGTNYSVTPHSRTYREYSITYDSSVEIDDDDDLKIEVVSPVFESLEEFEDNMTDVFRWIDRSGYTNDSTGFHVNIGFQDTDTELDLLKLQLLLGDEYVGQMFGRRFNHYANTVVSYIQQKVQRMRDDEFARLMDPKTRKEQVEEWLSKNDKYRSVNASKFTSSGYLEFRITGGDNYHMYPNKIMETVQRYLYVLKIAADPEAARREYLNKLGKLMHKAIAQKPVKQRQESFQLKKIFPEVRQSQIDFYNKHRDDAPRALPYFIVEILENGHTADEILNDKIKQNWLRREMKKYGWTKQKLAEVIAEYWPEAIRYYGDDLRQLGLVISNNQTTS